MSLVMLPLQLFLNGTTLLTQTQQGTQAAV